MPGTATTATTATTIGSVGRAAARPLDPGALYDELRPRLLAHCLRLTRNPDDAQDLLQDAFTRVLPRLPHLQPESAAVAGYLARTAENLHYRQWRRSRREVACADVDADGRARRSPDAATECEQRLDAAAVGAATRRLPARQRTALVLSAVDGLDSRAIGTILDLDENAVNQLRFRARRHLRRELDL